MTDGVNVHNNYAATCACKLDYHMSHDVMTMSMPWAGFTKLLRLTKARLFD